MSCHGKDNLIRCMKGVAMLLKTQRLTLTDYTIGDVSDYFKLKSCVPVWRYSTFTPLTDESQARLLFYKAVCGVRKG